MNYLKRALILMLVIFGTYQLTACSNNGKSGAVPTTGEQASKTATSQKVSTLSTAQLKGYKPNVVASAFTSCNIGNFDGKPLTDKAINASLDAEHSFTGWVIPQGIQNPRYKLRFEDKSNDKYLEGDFTLTLPRPDVVAAHGNLSPSLVSGFHIQLAPHSVPKGDYHIYIVITNGESMRRCDNGRHIDFK